MPEERRTSFHLAASLSRARTRRYGALVVSGRAPGYPVDYRPSFSVIRTRSATESARIFCMTRPR
jgi:hypothetical protein